MDVAKEERGLLDVLKSELEFLESGGYMRAPGDSWRPAFIFEDSPACVNHGRKNDPLPCSDCALMRLVPAEFRHARIPCRHIPLNSGGETLDSLYRYADRREIEEAFRKWLQNTIARLEARQKADHALQNEESMRSNAGENARGAAMNENLHAKCANPSCPNAFSWDKGGKFFRFRTEPHPAQHNDMTGDLLKGVHGVKHFWLCESCSHVFTLVYSESGEVVVKLLSRDLPVSPTHKELPAA